MTETIEVLLTSEENSTLFSSCVWDINTGTSVHIYKGGSVVAPNTVRQINNDYIIAADRLKPLLYVWQTNSQETLKNVRFVVPGKVTALDITNDGLYCVAAIEQKIYIWQIATGKLLAIASKHFQNITTVAFSSCGSFIVTGGEDGLVLVWLLSHLIAQQIDFISQTCAGQTDPIFTLSDHSMPVKAMCVGKSGSNARIATVSSDRTLKLYKLNAGKLLLSLVFDTCLTAVVLNSSETKAFVGTVNGDIFEVSFLNPPKNNNEYHHSSVKNEQNCFSGHTKLITCLSLSVDGQRLVSGGIDEQVIIWHVKSKQKIRTIPHKGAVLNAQLIIAPKSLKTYDWKPKTVITPFKRSLEESTEDNTIDVICTKDQKLPNSIEFTCEESDNTCFTGNGKGNRELLDEINKLKTINHRLYQFALNNIYTKDDHQQTNNNKKRKLL